MCGQGVESIVNGVGEGTDVQVKLRMTCFVEEIW